MKSFTLLLGFTYIAKQQFILNRLLVEISIDKNKTFVAVCV